MLQSCCTPATRGAFAVSADELADPDAALLGLWHQARKLLDDLNGALPMDSPEFEAGMKRLVMLQDLIAATPATTAQEWAVKILNADDGGAIQSNGRWADALLSEARDLMEMQA